MDELDNVFCICFFYIALDMFVRAVHILGGRVQRELARPDPLDPYFRSTYATLTGPDRTPD